MHWTQALLAAALTVYLGAFVALNGYHVYSHKA